MVNLSKEELDFLIELQHEMLTQDHVCQAYPRFWVLEDSKKTPTSIEYADGGYTVFDDNACEEIGDSMEQVVDYFNKKYDYKGLYIVINNGDAFIYQLDESLDEVDLDKLKKECDNLCGLEGYENDIEDEEEQLEPIQTYLDIDSLISELNDLSYVSEDLRVVNLRDETYIVPNTLFLTNRAAKAHIRQNHYHYSKDVHSYAMTAMRSPEVEQLWRILDKINWQELKEEKYGKDDGQLCGQ